MSLFYDLHTAVDETFSVKRSYFFFFLGSFLFGMLYVYAPIFITPGNDFAFFIQITPWWALALIFVLAALMGLLFAMNVYAWQKYKKPNHSRLWGFFTRKMSYCIPVASYGVCTHFAESRSLRIGSVGAGLGAGLASFVSGIFSSATCAACVSALFSFILPSAGIILLLEYRWWIVSAGIALVLLSIVLVSRKIASVCDSCRVK